MNRYTSYTYIGKLGELL